MFPSGKFGDKKSHKLEKWKGRLAHIDVEHHVSFRELLPVVDPCSYDGSHHPPLRQLRQKTGLSNLLKQLGPRVALCTRAYPHVSRSPPNVGPLLPLCSSSPSNKSLFITRHHINCESRLLISGHTRRRKKIVMFASGANDEGHAWTGARGPSGSNRMLARLPSCEIWFGTYYNHMPPAHNVCRR